MNQKRETEKISITFSEAAHYKKVPATGVYGGPTPNGDLLCNFFVESRVVPDRIEFELGPKGEKGPEKQQFEGSGVRFLRELQVGVLMNPSTAKSTGEWLIRHANKVLGIDSELS